MHTDTCQKYGYYYHEDADGDILHVAPYRDQSGIVCGQKIRGPSKKFWTTGSMGKGVQLFGQHLFRTGGRRLLVVEGEIDALSGYQMLGTWPVVSIPNGIDGAVDSIKANIEFLESYETVVFCFDQEEKAQRAAIECAQILTPGRGAIMSIPLKDASDMLQGNRIQEFTTAFWEAKEYRPDGIVNGRDLWDAINTEVEMGIPYPWPDLNRLTYGQRHGELVTWTSGTGMGKSAIVGEIAYDLLMKGHTVGYVALEENVGRTGQRIVGIHTDCPIHLPGFELPAEKKRRAFDETLASGRFYTFDHFGSLQSDDVISKIRYLAKGAGCDFIILDHLSIIVSGMEITDDERRTIDYLMTSLRSLVEETGVGFHLVSHLRRTDGDKGHENGSEIRLSHLRGSQSIAQLSNLVIGLERDQQAEDEEERNTATVRVLKNRYSGDTGVAGELLYVRDTGRLVPAPSSASAALDGEGDY